MRQLRKATALFLSSSCLKALQFPKCFKQFLCYFIFPYSLLSGKILRIAIVDTYLLASLPGKQLTNDLIAGEFLNVALLPLTSGGWQL